MAADSQESGHSSSLANATLNQNSKEPSNEHGHDRRTYETFAPPPSPPPNANLLPGGTENTAGGRMPELTLLGVFRSFTLEDFQTIHRKPCFRDALLAGISGGFLVGGVRAVLGAPIPKAANWAVGTLVGVSAVAHEYCQFRRRKEKESMRMVVELMERKKEERERQLKEVVETKRKAEEERVAKEKSSKTKWWSKW